MASTNKTPNFDLSQFIGSDKPTYLGDYNSDMSKIDTAMATNKTNSDNAVTVATGANETASNAQTIATQAQSTAQQANTLAQTAKSAADAAQAGVDKNSEAIKEINLTNFTRITTSQMSTNHGTIQSGSFINIATSPNSTLFKLYGLVGVENANYNGTTTVTLATSLRPTEDISINPAGIRVVYQGGINSVSIASFTVKTNGNIELQIYTGSSTNIVSAIYFPCVYWLKNFGDTPSDL